MSPPSRYVNQEPIESTVAWRIKALPVDLYNLYMSLVRGGMEFSSALREAERVNKAREGAEGVKLMARILKEHPVKEKEYPEFTPPDLDDEPPWASVNVIAPTFEW